MARSKNAKRLHYIAPWTSDDKMPTDTEWLRLAKFIQTIEDDSDENTDDQGFYDGDGNPETILTSRAERWNFEGFSDLEDPAQALIAGMKRKTGDNDRKLWHKIVETDGKTYVGVAKAMEIKAGSGDATDYEEFSGHLDFIGTPKEITAPETPSGN